MKHAFFTSDRPLVFAHRGGSALAPENTLAAFDNGLALGADGLELDVHLSRDGVVMVHHDRLLDRTTNLRGAIGERTAGELAHADAGWQFRRDDGFPFRGRGIGVPTLAEVLARYRGVPTIVELKENTVALAQAVVNVVRDADAIDRVCVGSFSLRGLRAVRAFEPAIATSAARAEVRWALFRLWCRWPLRLTAYAGYQVPERAGPTRVVSPRFVDAARRAGLGVQVWTIDTPGEATRLLGYGVDGLISDRPDVIVPLVRAHPRR
jgi:glycerophosphoryl diester phosphodiesterase